MVSVTVSLAPFPSRCDVIGRLIVVVPAGSVAVRTAPDTGKVKEEPVTSPAPYEPPVWRVTVTLLAGGVEAVMVNVAVPPLSLMEALLLVTERIG